MGSRFGNTALFLILVASRDIFEKKNSMSLSKWNHYHLFNFRHFVFVIYMLCVMISLYDLSLVFTSIRLEIKVTTESNISTFLDLIWLATQSFTLVCFSNTTNFPFYLFIFVSKHSSLLMISRENHGTNIIYKLELFESKKSMWHADFL